MDRSNKLKTLLRLPGSTWLLFLKAVAISAAVRFTMLFLSFNKVLGWLGTAQKETPAEATAQQLDYAGRVKTAIWLCRKYTPWKTECYVQALTAKILLNSRGIPATVYIGFFRNGAEMMGHAWLRTGNLIVTGAKTHASFQVHSFFS